MKKELIKVKMADVQIGNSPSVLITYGLGSCVGLTIWDSRQKYGGMAHIMLPSSKGFSKNENFAKFADSSIEYLVNEMLKMGSFKKYLEAKVFGGASMFTFETKSEILNIGERNIEATFNALSEFGIEVVGKDVGGNFGRTISLDLETGKVEVHSIKKGNTII
ncbi:MAG TPA: chemotaxis protein CheD [Firmicutes bacterium]|nr:chemotaxis protein CheD [Bacillota bacterium]